MDRIHVYIAGPLTRGDTAANIHEACRVGDILKREGLVPFVPHLSFFWHLQFPDCYERWLKYDLDMLARCDALLRLPGESPGADREVKRARELWIPVYGLLEDQFGREMQRLIVDACGAQPSIVSRLSRAGESK